MEIIHKHIKIISHKYPTHLAALVRRKVYAIEAVAQVVTSDILLGVRAALGRNGLDFVHTAEVNLQPLVTVVSFGRPACTIATAGANFESSAPRRVISVPDRRGRDGAVGNAATNHAERFELR